MAFRWRWFLAAFASAVSAQEITVHSEFTRVDPFGLTVRADRGSNPPREILSPAIARNAYASYHVVVHGRPHQPFTLQVAQNPERAVRVSAYRELYEKVGEEWIPDRLEPVTLPYDGRLGENGIAGQTAQAFWVDLVADRNAPVRRIKVEPQVYMDEAWLQYPMEVRVRRPALNGPLGEPLSGALSVSQPSSASALVVWVQTLCGSGENKRSESPLSIRNFIARNSLQDVGLAGGVPPPGLLHWTGVSDRAGFCRRGAQVPPDAETYLNVRDALVGGGRD